jgi:transposase
MPTNDYRTFFEENQSKFQPGKTIFIPMGYPNAGVHHQLSAIREHLQCPHCGCAVTYIHDHKSRAVHAGAYLGVPVIYDLVTIRYECSQCSGTFMVEYDFLPWHRTITEETENYITCSLGSKTFSVIAEETGLSVQTVANRAAAYGKEEREIMLSGHYRFLSMDEVYIGRDKNGGHIIYWVLNDISIPWKSNNIIVTNGGRALKDVVQGLKLLKRPECAEAVCIDMWAPYVSAIETALLNAVPVIDRFHVIKLAEESVNAARRAFIGSKALAGAMKKDAALFLCSMDKLSTDEWARLENYLRVDEKLEKTYFLVQELLEFYYARGYEEALEYLCAWESHVISSGVSLPIYETVCNWLPYIMNYFRFRITNGKMEGRNNLIRQIDRMGFHYGIVCFQGCLYAHDRKQEYFKWQLHLRKITLASRLRKESVIKPNPRLKPAA